MDSRRLQIIKGMAAHFEAMNDAVGLSTKWTRVSTSPLTPADRRMRASLSITPASESKKPMVLAGGKGRYDCNLVLRLHWYYLVDKATEPDTLTAAENVLCEVQKWVDRANDSGQPLSGLARGILEVNNEVRQDNENDIQIEGVLLVVCAYSHLQGDPTQAK